MSIVPQFYLNAVVSIGTRMSDEIRWIGTGFFALRKANADGRGYPLLITNKHVLTDEDTIVIRIRKKDSEDFDTVDVPLIEEGKPHYVCHPDKAVDIAVLLLNGAYFVENELAFDCFDIDEHALTSTDLRQEGVDEGSLVYMLGFPMGLVNSSSRLPICRLGCIARMSEAQIKETHNLIVDIQNFPGNSGSPIITRPEVVAIQGTKPFNKSVLLGIVHAYIPYSEQLINSQTQKVVEIRTENSGLALVHPVEYIREVIDLISPLKPEGDTQESASDKVPVCV